jgi:hypothetical protein
VTWRASASKSPDRRRGPAAEASNHAERLDLQAEQDQRIQAQGRAVFYLPALADGIESGGIGVLADELTTQEMV